MPTKIDFIGGNTKRCLMAMALPMIAAMFLNMMYNLVDSLWIGNLLGETAYAALTNSTPIILILTSVAMGATNGVSILISQAIGAKDKKKTESLISTSFCVAVVFSLLVTVPVSYTHLDVYKRQILLFTFLSEYVYRVPMISQNKSLFISFRKHIDKCNPMIYN